MGIYYDTKCLLRMLQAWGGGCGLVIEYLLSLHKTLGQGRGKERKGRGKGEREFFFLKLVVKKP